MKLNFNLTNWLKKKDDQVRNDLAEDYPWFNISYNNKKAKPKINPFSIPSFYRAINLVGDLVSGLPLDIYRKTDLGRIKDTDNPWYDCFRHQANDQQSIRDFLKLSYTMRAYWGNVYWLIDPNTHTLTLLDPEKTSPFQFQGVKFFAYELNKEQDQYLYFGNDEIIHLKTMQTDFSSGKGLAISDLFRLLLNLAINQEAYQSNFVDANAAIKGVLTTDQSITDPNKLRSISSNFGNYIQEDQDGNTRHTVPVLSNGIKFQPINLTPQELALIQKKQDVVRDICAVIGVPTQFLGIGNVSYSSLEQTNMQFLVYSIQPLLDEIISEISTKIFNKQDRQAGIYAEFNVEKLLMIDSKSKTDNIDKQIKNGSITVNEARSMLNLPALEHNDKNLIPTNMTFPDAMQAQKELDVETKRLINEKLQRELDSKAALAQLDTENKTLVNEKLKRELDDQAQAKVEESQQAQAKMKSKSVVDFNNRLMAQYTPFVKDAASARVAIDQITKDVTAKYNVTTDKNILEFVTTYCKGTDYRFEKDDHSAQYELNRFINALSRQCFVQMGIHDVQWHGGELDGITKPLYLPFKEKSEQLNQKHNIYHPPLSKDDTESWLIPAETNNE